MIEKLEEIKKRRRFDIETNLPERVEKERKEVVGG